VNVVNPTGLAITEWCDYTTDNLARFVSPMKIGGDSEWREWGAHALRGLRTRGVTPPNPYKFADFYEWAQRFNQAVATL
jgi:hypothetical protein